MASNSNKILIFQEPQSRNVLNFFLVSKSCGNVIIEARLSLARAPGNLLRYPTNFKLSKFDKNW